MDITKNQDQWIGTVILKLKGTVMETGKKFLEEDKPKEGKKLERIEWMRGNIGRSNNQKYLHNSNPKVSVTRASKQMGEKTQTSVWRHPKNYQRRGKLSQRSENQIDIKANAGEKWWLKAFMEN